ncbi:uncharacterized protein LOC9638139 [Selaginella moellendorffii]|nr:uncharacterized protein LOC9638139 [Selaginella moellendorffii]|eukprot:XP_002975198.2 uncharacterized protein LOC9638139 [Selaginella moellendorffii]
MGCLGINLIKFRLQQGRKLMRRCGLQQKQVKIEAGNTTLDCWVPSAAKEGRPALLLLHGFVFNALLEWENQLLAFTEKFNVYVPNLLFFGESTTESGERSEIFQAQCMKLMLDELQVLDRVHALGTSYGGMVAFWMAHLYPERIARVVLASSGVAMDHGDSQRMLERFGGGVAHPADVLMPRSVQVARKTMEFATQKKLALVPDCLVEDIIEEVLCYNREHRLELLDGMAIGSVENPPVVPQLVQDVLILWGENDQIFTVDLAHRLQRHLSDSKLEIIPGAAHAPQVDNPKAFNGIVVKFLYEN